MTMMTGTGRELPAWQRRWAAEQLGVDAQASALEARSVFLRRLVESDFVPPAMWPQALAMLDGRPAPVGEARARREEAERLRGEVEEFAERFWLLPVDERWRRWQELFDACTMVVALRARLTALKRGLDIGPAEAGRPQIADVVRNLQQLFVLRPAERAARRRELLVAAQNDRAAWQVAAVVRHQYPEIAALEPQFLAELAKGAERQQRRAGVQRALFRTRRPAAPKPVTSGGGSGRFPWWVLGIIGVVIGAIRAGIGDKPSSRPEPVRPSFVQPRWSQPQMPTFSPPPDVDVQKLLDDLRRSSRASPGAPPSQSKPQGKPSGPAPRSSTSGSGPP
jgi:hypothetical protein